MTSAKPKSSYVVKFAQTEADQELSRAVDSALEGQSYKSFSDLCKQALRLMLLTNTPTLPMMAVLEQQVMTLQLQIMQLEQRSKETGSQTTDALAQQVQQLTERITQLEQKLEAAALAPAPKTEETDPEPSDPLLSRLAPLLEDF